MELNGITQSCGPGSAAARDRGIASCATDSIQDTQCHGPGAPSKASSFSCGSKELNTPGGLCMPRTVSPPFPAWDQAVTPALTRAAGRSRQWSIHAHAAGWTRACDPKLKPSEAFPPLSFTWKRQDTRCTLSGNNNECQNRRILIGFNTEADKRGEQQRKQYYTILRTINHLLV